MKENTKQKALCHPCSPTKAETAGKSESEAKIKTENQDPDKDGDGGSKKCQIKLSERLLTHFRGPLHKLLIS